MKKMILPVVLLAFLCSCDQVKVTNSNDNEAVPVRVVQTQAPTEPAPTEPTPIPNPVPAQTIYGKYEVATGNGIEEFKTNVRAKMSEGYQPIGGICNYGGGSFAQAMGK